MSGWGAAPAPLQPKDLNTVPRPEDAASASSTNPVRKIGSGNAPPPLGMVNGLPKPKAVSGASSSKPAPGDGRNARGRSNLLCWLTPEGWGKPPQEDGEKSAQSIKPHVAQIRGSNRAPTAQEVQTALDKGVARLVKRTAILIFRKANLETRLDDSVKTDKKRLKALGFDPEQPCFQFETVDETGPLDPTDDIVDPKSSVPPPVQKLWNIHDWASALGASVDLLDQIHLLPNGEPSPIPLHTAGNVQVVPLADNLAKKGALNEVCQMHLLAILRHQ
ncbi:hypothetical protein Q8F55_009135 [Vanrija albida]|uniref:Uncharacterized protein n=1 Tax=Vanrija albida TaxID=181172 RepID=A0ABR3PSU8_9TREE